jgi:hypothetical protein
MLDLCDWNRADKSLRTALYGNNGAGSRLTKALRLCRLTYLLRLGKMRTHLRRHREALANLEQLARLALAGPGPPGTVKRP